MTDSRGSRKRALLVGTAMTLVHANGYGQTTLADIANAAGIPLGNVYYYFKTKDALCEAVIDQLADHSQALRDRWDVIPDPKDRLAAYLQMTVETRDAVARSGCPIGTLCAELHKDGGPLAEASARLLGDLLAWLEAQLRLVGVDDARGLAVQLLSAIQGASLLSHTFHDPQYLEAEAKRLEAQIRELPGPRAEIQEAE